MISRSKFSRIALRLRRVQPGERRSASSLARCAHSQQPPGQLAFNCHMPETGTSAISKR